MIPAQSASPPGSDESGGLRSRKKAKTRRAIEDAALALFVEQGYDATTLEEIAERAEVSITTIFRYFPSKAHVIRGDQEAHLPVLARAIVDRPSTESEFDAVRHAIQEHRVATMDPQRTVRYTRAIATSHVLRGISYDIGQMWLREVAGALAHRRGLDVPDQRCWLAARVCSAVFAMSIEAWVDTDGAGDIARMVDDGFDVLRGLCGDWLEPKPPGVLPIH